MFSPRVRYIGLTQQEERQGKGQKSADLQLRKRVEKGPTQGGPQSVRRPPSRFHSISPSTSNPSTPAHPSTGSTPLSLYLFSTPPHPPPPTISLPNPTFPSPPELEVAPLPLPPFPHFPITKNDDGSFKFARDSTHAIRQPQYRAAHQRPSSEWRHEPNGRSQPI